MKAGIAPARGIRARVLGLWLIVLALGCGAAAFIAPLQSPDEHSHLFRAYMISQGHWGLQTPPGGNSGGMVDQGLLEFADAYMSTVALRPDARLTLAQQTRADTLRWGGPQRFFPVPGTGYYLPLVYAPHAAALMAGRVLDMTVADTYRLCRFLTLAVCLALFATAFRILAPPLLASALLLLPMSVFQILSPTLDGITTALATLALALFMRGALQKSRPDAARALALSSAVMILATSRIQLLPLLGLPFFLAWRHRSGRDAWLGALATVVSLAWVLFALLHTIDLRVVRSQGTVEILLHYARHPLGFAQVVGNSLREPELSQFYAQSFIGILGWLDTRLPAALYLPLWVGLAVCAGITVLAAPAPQAISARMFLLVAAVGSAALVFLALLATWTPHPAVTVAGVQGRYFIVPALMAAYAVGGSLQFSRFPRLYFWTLAAFAVLSLSTLLATLAGRYH